MVSLGELKRQADAKKQVYAEKKSKRIEELKQNADADFEKIITLEELRKLTNGEEVFVKKNTNLQKLNNLDQNIEGVYLNLICNLEERLFNEASLGNSKLIVHFFEYDGDDLEKNNPNFRKIHERAVENSMYMDNKKKETELISYQKFNHFYDGRTLTFDELAEDYILGDFKKVYEYCLLHDLNPQLKYKGEAYDGLNLVIYW